MNDEPHGAKLLLEAALLLVCFFVAGITTEDDGRPFGLDKNGAGPMAGGVFAGDMGAPVPSRNTVQ